VSEYIKIVDEKYTLRNLLRAVHDIQTAVETESDATEVMQFAEGRILDVISKEVRNDTRPVSDVLWETFDELEKRIEAGGDVPGVPMGFPRLDRVTSGLKEGQLITIAGRPAMGKTSFALNVALNASITHGVGTVLFSLEMGEMELMERMLSSEARVDSTGLRIGKLTEMELTRITEAAGLVNQAPIFINDSASMTPAGMRGHVRRLQQEHDIGLVIVDYIQLMSLGDHRFTGNRVAEVSKISRDLKVLARDLKVPIVALSQLNRGVESRDDKRPQLSDLRESGSIEQDSDIVMFVYRPEVYEGSHNKSGENIESEAEIIIRKQRNGPTGKVSFEFFKEYTRFEEKVTDVYTKHDDKGEQDEGDEEVQTLAF
jgi:replicative DNA helicase